MSLNTLVKKLNYIIVSNKELALKEKIVSNIEEQNVVIGKRTKGLLKAYVGFLTNVTRD